MFDRVLNINASAIPTNACSELQIRQLEVVPVYFYYYLKYIQCNLQPRTVVFLFLALSICSETHSEPGQTSNMKFFAEIVNSFIH